MPNSLENGGLRRAIQSFTRKNLLIIVLCSLSLTLILNLHLIDFSFMDSQDASFIDVKLPKTSNEHKEPGAHDSKKTTTTPQGGLKDKLNFFREQKQETKTASMESFLSSYNVSEFQITRENELDTPFIFSEILRSYPLSYISSLTQHDKCQLYFEELYAKNPKHWGVGEFNDIPHDKGAYRRVRYAKLENNGTLDMTKDSNKIDLAKKIRNDRLERKQMDVLRHYKAYDACFLSNEDAQERQSFAQKFNVTDLELRLFPWFNFRLPTFTRWDGLTIHQKFPLMGNFTTGQNEKHLLPELSSMSTTSEDRESYLAQMRASFNGKGFVISAGNRHAPQAFQLIALLRALGNKLPIQIFHYGDLDEKYQDKLIHIARDCEGLQLEGTVDNLSYILKHKGIKNIHNGDPNEIEKLFPPQELWFVNAKGTLKPEYRHYYNGFGNKLIAYFFNSFKEAILMDTDTVPVVDLDYNLLQSQEFQTKGAYFFQDRELDERYPDQDLTPDYFTKKLFPSKLDSFFLGTKPLTNHTLDTRFFRKFDRHYMESGVVAVNKHRHFLPVLNTMLINQFDQVTSVVYGDKELFWLAFAVSGSEDYYMNKWPAGAIGSAITPMDKRIYHDNDNSTFYKNEICSAHPAHLSGVDDKTLLWFNSGFVRCKEYEKSTEQDLDLRLNPKRFDTLFELKQFYSSYQNFEYLLVPGQTDYSGAFPYFENWWRMNECNGYIWCAYNNQSSPFASNNELEFGDFSIANHTQVPLPEVRESCPQRSEREKKDGVLVAFEEGEKLYYNYLGSVYDNVLKIYNLRYV